jgi:hypothetical protein
VIFDLIKPGMTVYATVRQSLAPGTRTLTTAVRVVHVMAVDPQSRSVVAAIEGQDTRTYWRGMYKRWHVQQPVLVPTAKGGHRVATPKELKAMKEGI